MIELTPVRGPVDATIRVPGSKSYTNRALAVAALADGTSHLTGALESDDTRYMSAALGELGLRVVAEPGGETLRVEGEGGRWPNSSAELYCGNAGTAVRFLLALVAAGQGTYVIDGSPRMRQRPQGPLLAALRALGAEVVSQFDNDSPPITIHANGLAGGGVAVDGSVSSQYFSALCQVAPLMANGLELVVEGDLVSKPYLDMTAAVMAAFGVTLVNESYGRFLVAPGQTYRATEYAVEPDASSASYFFAAAALTGGHVVVPGLRRGSQQGDIGFLEVLERLGASVAETPAGVAVTGPSELAGISIDMNAISDTALTLAALAPFAQGPTEIRGIGHARAQESDRIAALATELRRLGVQVEERPDGWRIEPGWPEGAIVDTYDDHRIAMSLALVGLKVPGVRIRHPECVNKTFPSFWHRWTELTESAA